MIKLTLVLLVALVAQNNGARLDRAFPRLDGRIVGGSATPIEEIPYQLSLEANGTHYCGANIISSTWALTAAHCVSNMSISQFTLRSGTSVRESGGTVHQAVEIVVHPMYGTNGIDWDYAVIRVGTPYPLGQPGCEAIQLAEVEPTGGEEALASGWGRLNPGGELPDSLQSVRVPIVSRADCTDMYEGFPITDRMVCAGEEEGGKDACQGDSGGPLVSGGKLVGLVSWGFGCAKPRTPGVYTNVVNQVSWIREVTGV